MRISEILEFVVSELVIGSGEQDIVNQKRKKISKKPLFSE